MSHGIFQKMRGVKGKVWIPSLGAMIGTMAEWHLTRRGGEGTADGSGLYDLRAVFSYLNLYLWDDNDYEKEIVIVLGKTKQFRVRKVNDEETVLADRTLLMKGVALDVYEDR